MRSVILVILWLTLASMSYGSYGYMEVDPNPASIPEYYTVYFIFANTTGHDITVYTVEDSGSEYDVDVEVSAGNYEVVYSASGVTYTPGTFYHKLTFYTSDGAFEADPYTFLVK